ncbi:hypothetical protein ATANTOWER_031341 [Ataeniobius toweri]|uniref:Uncharacterized protein n=1 Tax=Ataeniobius toweri TaxID=208326 RepID=A0ABU7BT23_9TELE|nr:hypothetical protein [Ataeniobius toweri]
MVHYCVIQVCRSPETTYQASDDSNSTLDKPLPSCLASLTSSEPACPLSNTLRILDSDPVTVVLTTRTTPLKPKQETMLTNRKLKPKVRKLPPIMSGLAQKRFMC